MWQKYNTLGLIGLVYGEVSTHFAGAVNANHYHLHSK